MTKRELQRVFNSKVYAFAESLGYDIEDNGDGSCVTFVHPDSTSGYDSIDYSRSQQDIHYVNWASDKVKEDAVKIEAYIDQLKAA
jgi:hypothetical protein